MQTSAQKGITDRRRTEAEGGGEIAGRQLTMKDTSQPSALAASGANGWKGTTIAAIG